MIFNQNLQIILLLIDFCQEFRIEYITLNGSFSIICNKSQNLKILYYLITGDIRANFRLH